LHPTQLPAPSHTLPPASVQAVPDAASSAPHFWATHVTVWHVLLVPGQSATALHCGAPVVLLVLDVVVLLVLDVVVLDVAVSLVLDVVVRLLVEAVPPLAVALEVPLVPPCPPVGCSRLSP
jgi:hypothetical protein